MTTQTCKAGWMALGAALAFSAAAQTTPDAGARLPSSDSTLGATSSPATAATSQSNVAIRGKDMKKLDKNKDGMVSREEAQSDRDWSKLFTEMDGDGNGMITSAELLRLEDRAKASDTTRTLPADEQSDLGTPRK